MYRRDNLRFPSISYGGVFDQSFLLPHTTVLSQLTATAKISDRDDNVCKSIIDECNIAPYLKHHISKLSTGNKQRLSLAYHYCKTLMFTF